MTWPQVAFFEVWHRAKGTPVIRTLWNSHGTMDPSPTVASRHPGHPGKGSRYRVSKKNVPHLNPGYLKKLCTWYVWFWCHPIAYFIQICMFSTSALSALKQLSNEHYRAKNGNSEILPEIRSLDKTLEIRSQVKAHSNYGLKILRGKMLSCSKVRCTKFRDDWPIRSRIIIGKPEEAASTPCACDG